MKVDVLRALVLTWIFGQQGERVAPPQPLLLGWRVALAAFVGIFFSFFSIVYIILCVRLCIYAFSCSLT